LALNEGSPGRRAQNGNRAEAGAFATKPLDQLRETADGTRLHRAVGALDLTALGIGAIIGTGIFVIVGKAISE
jgi:APA family basic amino acid/polyamine antiporter